MSTDKHTKALFAVVIVLLCAKLAVSGYIALRPTGTSAGSPSVPSTVSEARAMTLANRVVPLYNAGNATELYATFDSLARVSFTEEVLAAQITKLKSLLGTVSNYAYSHAEPGGVQGGRTFYNLLFKTRLSGSSMKAGEMKLTVYEKDNEFVLVGFFLFGNEGPMQ